MIIFLIIIYLIIGTFVFTLYVKSFSADLIDEYFKCGLISLIWPLLIVILPLWILYKFFIPVANYVLDYISNFDHYFMYKKFERFIIENNIYSQVVNSVLTHKGETLKEYVYREHPYYLIQHIIWDSKDIDYHELSKKWQKLI